MNMPISEDDLSKQLGLSMNTLYRLRESGKLDYTRIGKRVFYTEQHIQSYLKIGDTALGRKRGR